MIGRGSASVWQTWGGAVPELLEHAGGAEAHEREAGTAGPCDVWALEPPGERVGRRVASRDHDYIARTTGAAGRSSAVVRSEADPPTLSIPCQDGGEAASTRPTSGALADP